MGNVTTLFLIILVSIGTFATFLAVFGLLAPREKKDDLMDVSVRRFKSTSSFARLKPEEKFMDRLAVFCLQNLHVEDTLEEIHMQLGSPETPQPVDILYSKITAAMLIPAVMMVLFMSIWPVVFVPLCFYIPDVLLKSKIQKRQAEILGNFSTTVDLAALIIESGLDYLTAFERIIKIAKEKTILEEELEQTINEIKLGYSRREALEHFANRTGVQEVRSLVGLIIQSDELGTSLVFAAQLLYGLAFSPFKPCGKISRTGFYQNVIPDVYVHLPDDFYFNFSPDGDGSCQRGYWLLEEHL